MADERHQNEPLPRLEALHERLNYLFKRANVSSSTASLRQVEAWIRDQASKDDTGLIEPMTHGYLGFLLRGKQDNPSVKKLRALARYFDVPPAWLLGDFDGAEQSRLETGQPRVDILAAKARGLAPRDLAVVEKLVASLLEPDDRDPHGR